MEPDFIVTGEKVALGPLRADLAATYARWRNQPEIRRGIDWMGVETPESMGKFVEEAGAAGAGRSPTRFEFTIYDRSDSTPVGTAGLFDVNYVHGRCAFGIEIGERRGQGLGTGATRLVLQFAFGTLQMCSVMLEALEWNVAGLKAYERAGFRRIGVRRSAALSRGRRFDVVLMDATLEDVPDETDPPQSGS